MKTRKHRIWIVALLCFALNGLVANPSSAAGIFLTKVQILDPDGRGVQGVGIQISTKNSRGTNLGVQKVTDSKGQALVQTYEGAYTLWLDPGVEGSSLCISTRPSVSGTISPSNPTIRLSVPKVTRYDISVMSASGAPAPGVQVTIGTGGALFPNDLGCSMPVNNRTNEQGIVRIPYFDEAIFNYPERAAIVNYVPFEGTTFLTYEISSDEISTGDYAVMLDDVPSASLTGPTTVKNGSTFSLTGAVLNPSGEIAASSVSLSKAFGTAAARTQYKKVELWASSSASKSRWSSWKKLQTQPVSASGKFTFGKLKQSTTVRYQVRGFGYLLGSKPIVVSAKK